MSIQAINPTTGEPLQAYAETPPAAMDPALRQAAEAFRHWRHTPFGERAAVLQNAAVILRRDRDEHARLMALEMGKPITQGRAEVEKCAWACGYFAAHAEAFLAREPVACDGAESYVMYQPLGTVLAVMPWNFPFWQVFRAAVPALMAGNAMVLKHASNVPGCALAIEAVLREAGLPAGLFQSLLVPSSAVGDIVAHPLIQAVTLTGSVAAGRAIAAQAGAHLKKTVLELGGSDPYVVLEDCDLDAAVASCVQARLLNSGQSCIAAKRFIVVETIRHEFEQRFVERMRAEHWGDPLDEITTVGPLARSDLRDELHGQVTRSLAQGARLLLGGTLPRRAGWFYPPTVLGDVRPDMPAGCEETFGPVAAIIGVRDEAEAVRVANDSVFGLGAAVFTRDRPRGERIAAELEAGNCYVNDFVKSDPRLPFGGIKQSGYGRELGPWGIREFVNIKTVRVTPPAP